MRNNLNYVIQRKDSQNSKNTSQSVEAIIKNKKVLETDIMKLIFALQHNNHIKVSSLRLCTSIENLDTNEQKSIIQKVNVNIGIDFRSHQ